MSKMRVTTEKEATEDTESVRRLKPQPAVDDTTEIRVDTVWAVLFDCRERKVEFVVDLYKMLAVTLHLVTGVLGSGCQSVERM